MDIIREDISRQLLQLLTGNKEEKKTLVVDPSLSGFLSFGVDSTLLRTNGVEKVVALTPTDLAALPANTNTNTVSAPNSSSKSILIILRPNMRLTRDVAHWLKRNPPSLPVSVLFVPRRSLVCERVFDEESVASHVSLGYLPLDLIPLDEDVLSLELDEFAFRDLFLYKDPSCLYTTAKALMKIQALHGIIPKVIGKGVNAQALSNLMLRMRKELDATASIATDSDASDKDNQQQDQHHQRRAFSAAKSSPFRVFPPKMDFDSIIILDRTVDLVTPLCMQLTYEGLVDEVFGIKTTFVQVNESFISAPAAQQQSSKAASSNAAAAVAAPPKLKKVSLNPALDKIYSQLRDLNFMMVGSVLSQNARRIQEEVDARHDAKTISQIKDFIGKLGGLEGDKAFLQLHTNLAEEITKITQDPDFNKFLEVQQNVLSGIQSQSQIDTMEELICKQAPLLQSLRLMCLYSVVCGGFKSKPYELLRKEFIQTYGIEHLVTLQNLESVSLLTSPESSSSFASARKQLQLIIEDVDEQNPTDFAYVYSGYAPLSVRLVEAAAGMGIFPKGFGGGGTGIKGTGGGAVGGLAGVSGKTLGGVTWDGMEDVLKTLGGGPHFEVRQDLPDASFVLRDEKERKKTLVLYLGGCTSTEISSLRFLSLKSKGNRQFVAMTTSMITGSRMISSLIESVDRKQLVE